MPKKHVLSLADLEPEDIAHLVERTVQIAASKGAEMASLRNRAVGIYFRKTSTRTRTSFTIGAAKLGATVIAYGPQDLQIATGETIQDTAKVLSEYLDALVIRSTDDTDELYAFAEQDEMSIINAMNSKEHPTQALSDLAMVRRHFGRVAGLHILYVGEGNSTAAGLALAISKTQDVKLTLLTPRGYGLPEDILTQARLFSRRYGAQVIQYHDVDSLPEQVDVVYATRWQTTGSTKSDPNWREAFWPFRVTRAFMSRVSKPSGTIFMHDLPAVREEDVTSDVLDGPQSIAFQQAGNKLYGAMAVLEWSILGNTGKKLV